MVVKNSTTKTLGIKKCTIAKVKNTKNEEVNKIKNIGLIVTDILNCTEKKTRSARALKAL